MNDTHVKLPNGQIAVRYQIIGTRIWIYALYEPSSYCGPHSSLLTIDDRCHGRVGTRRPSDDLEALPSGPTRSAAVCAFYEAQYQEAYTALRAAFPETAGVGGGVSASRVRERDGELEVVR